jgi:hypothetical protein
LVVDRRADCLGIAVGPEAIEDHELVVGIGAEPGDLPATAHDGLARRAVGDGGLGGLVV